MINATLFLRRVLQLDAVASGAMGALLALAPGWTGALLNLPEQLLLPVGVFLIGYAAFVGWLGSHTAMPRALLLVVIIGNFGWTVASFILLFSGAVSPNLLGQIFIAAQAVAVGVFAELQFVGLRKSGAAQPA